MEVSEPQVFNSHTHAQIFEAVKLGRIKISTDCHMQDGFIQDTYHDCVYS